MLELNNQYTLMKRRIDTAVVKSFFDDTILDDIDRLPFELIPKDRVPSRCCIYKERAMVRYRILTLLGVDLEKNDDEIKPLAEYVKEVLEEDNPTLPLLTTIKTGCYGCPQSQYKISDSCRGCFARPCMQNCPKDAIVFINGQAHIQEDRCIRCGKCMDVCPFHAVVHIPVPCEEACPVGAIKKNEEGVAQVDHAKCIGCGKCVRSCPFGAITERSELFHTLKMIKSDAPVIAMIAPAIDGQFPGTLPQIKAALKKVGFSDVFEVSEGAEVTAVREGKELAEKIEEGAGYMTTSCCPAYMNLIEKHLTFLKERKSDSLSPMAYAAEICKERWPGCKTVFVGPCLAKRVEAAKYDTIDGVITFAELAAMFIARGIDVKEMPADDLGDTDNFEDCRDFAVTGGVAGCVLNRLPEREVKIMKIDGLDVKNVRLMKTWQRKAPDADLVEVMCCEGGCIAGPGTIVKPAVALRLRNANKAALAKAKAEKAAAAAQPEA